MLQTTIHRSGLVLVLAGSLGWVALAEQSDVHAIADKVDQRYNHMQTLQAQFAETYSGAGMKRTESGTLELKKPGRMRWDYTEPRPKMFVTDGATAWFYVPGERQARRAPVKQIEDLRSPLRYLLGKTKLEKEFPGLAVATDMKPGRMRWDYTEPRPKMFVTDGATAWFYVPGERQARRAPVKQIEDLRSPLRYLLGKTKLEKEFLELTIATDAKPVNAGDIVLRGVPKGMQERVSQTLLEVTADGLITRIVVEEMDGSVTEFRFLQQKENVQVSDQRFRFTPPPGVEVVQGTELVN